MCMKLKRPVREYKNLPADAVAARLEVPVTAVTAQHPATQYNAINKEASRAGEDQMVRYGIWTELGSGLGVWLAVIALVALLE